MYAIADIFSLIWQPFHALESLRKRAAFGTAFGCAWLACFVYTFVAQPLAMYAQGSPALEGSKAALLIGYGLPAARTATMLALFVAAWYAPVALWLGNKFGERAKYAAYWPSTYRGFVTCSLAALTVAVLMSLLPALVIGWQAHRLPSEAVLGFFILILTMPLPIFAALMTLALGINLPLNWGRAVVVTLLSFLSFVGLVVLLQAFALVWVMPLLAILIAVFLRMRSN